MLPVKKTRKGIPNRNVISHVFTKTTHVVAMPCRFACGHTLDIPSFIEIQGF